MHLYIHIPFCKKACHYCDFHFSTQTDYADRMVNAICTELVLRKFEVQNALETIYFGGGTPSVLSEKQLKKIFHVIYENYLIAENPEITLEANPDDLTEEKLTELKSAGVNRLSIGIQSFRDEDLKWMNRSHNAGQAEACVRMAQKTGFDNITIDLIYGIPSLTASDWEKNLTMAVNLNPKHISAYCLTIESKTVFGHRLKKGDLNPVDDEKSSEQFIFMRKFLGKHGFVHYEISNFAKPGFESKHNTSYWKGHSYLGVGPGAHSYDGFYRRWNVANNQTYMQGIENGMDYFEEEELTMENRMNEAIMISLRTVGGLNSMKFRECFGEENTDKLMKRADKHFSDGNLVSTDGFIQATEKGLLLIDAICADLFF